jgi:hypothetical protein
MDKNEKKEEAEITKKTHIFIMMKHEERIQFMIQKKKKKNHVQARRKNFWNKKNSSVLSFSVSYEEKSQ